MDLKKDEALNGSKGKDASHRKRELTSHGEPRSKRFLKKVRVIKCQRQERRGVLQIYDRMGLERTKLFLENRKNLECILLFSNKEGILKEYTANTYK